MLAARVATSEKLTPSPERSTWNSSSSALLSVHETLIVESLTAVAERLLGAAGGCGVRVVALSTLV